jgi:single-strand DNA-binding protein
MRCSLWRQPAENLVESLSRGDRVVVAGRLRQRTFEKDGQKRSVIELDVDEVGPSLKYATVKVTKVNRSSAGQPSSQPGGDPWPTAPADDSSVPF